MIRDERGVTIAKCERAESRRMWPSRGGKPTVTCVACGGTVPRPEAREYDKHGDRWDREGKAFEHLCKPCHRGLCRHSREGLEALLVEIDAGERSREGFLAAYLAAVERQDRLEGRE